MLCARESLFTKRTRVPGEMFNCVVLTPADVIVMVVVLLVPPPPPVDGVDGDPPPHAARGNNASKGSSRRTRGLSHPPSLAQSASYGGQVYWTVMLPWNAVFVSFKWSWYEQVPVLATACVTFVCPAPIVPRPASIDGQLPCCG